MKIVLVFAVLFFSIYSQASVLGLEQYLELIKKEDAEIKRYIHQRVQTRFQADLELPDSSWVLSLTNSHGIAVGQAPTTRRTDVSLNKNFRDTGTTIELGYNKNTLADRQEAVHSVELRQSLLRNFFGQRMRTWEKSLSLQNKVTIWQVVESYEDYVAEKLGLYLDYVLAWQNFKTAESQFKDMENIWKDIQQRRRQNIALAVDIHRAEVEKIQFERNLISARLEMNRVQKSLFDRIDNKKVKLPVQPQGEVPFLGEDLAFGREKNEFLSSGRSMQIQKYRVESAQLAKDSHNRNYYPEAQLILGYNQDQSRRFSTPVNREEKVIGVNFSYEFDSSQRGAQVAQARYNLQQAELLNLSEKRRIDTLMDILENQIVLQKQRVELLKRQTTAAKKLFKGESKRFQKGTIDLKTLIDTQNSFSSARYELISEQVLLARHILNWKTLLDQLVDSDILKESL